MNVNALSSILMENCKTVAVSFGKDESRTYTYKTTEDFEVGDFAVVKPNNTLKVVKVVKVHEIPELDVNSNMDYDWIVQRIDLESYENLVEKGKLFESQLRYLQHQRVKQQAKQLLAESLDLEELDVNVAIQKLNA